MPAILREEFNGKLRDTIATLERQINDLKRAASCDSDARDAIDRLRELSLTILSFTHWALEKKAN